MSWRIVFILVLLAFSRPSLALDIFACEPEWASLAKSLAPEAEVYSATTVYQDPHHIQARPSLVAKLRQADMLICSGADLEVGWLPLLLRQAGNPKVQPDKPGYLMAADHVERLEIPAKVSRDMGDAHAAGNPHVHLDPHRLLKVAGVLHQRLKAIDAKHSEAYDAAYQQFVQAWQQSISRWESLAQPLKGLPYVAYHKGFTYLADWLGLDRVATIEPKPGVPPSAKYLQQLRAELSQRPLRFIMVTPYEPKRAAQQLAKALGLPLLVLPYSVDAERATDLEAVFEQTLSALLAQL